MRGRLNTELPAASAVVTPETPMRSIGDLPRDVWAQELARVDSPLLAEVEAIVRAASPHGALALVQAWRESGYGASRSAVDRRNPIGLMEADGRTLMRFAAWADAFAEFSRRLSDPSYKGGVYAPADLPLRDYVRRYVAGPGPGYANGETAESVARYLDRLVADLNRLRAAAGPGTGPPDGPPVSPPPLDFGPHPWPSGFDVALLTLPPAGRGWDDLGDRAAPGAMVGVCCHHTAGNDDRDSVRALFDAGGGRFGQAMTDAVIDRGGKGYLMLDPWGASRRVTPWASGPATSLKGPGVPFVQQLGANAVNKRLFSTEHSHAEGQRFTDAQIDLSAKVHAVVISRERIAWDRWPYNDAVGGLDVALYHRHFAPTTCPSDEWANNVYPAWVEAVRAEAKRLQTGGAAPPGPEPPTPPGPPAPWPLGFTEQEIATFWGTLRRRLGDGTTREYPFDPNGVIAALWLARARDEGRFPAALEWWTDASGWNFVSFGVPGDVDWLLGIPSLASRGDWRWVDRSPA